MRLHDDLYVLPITREGQLAPLKLSLILDPVAGPALVDTGMPGGDVGTHGLGSASE